MTVARGPRSRGSSTSLIAASSLRNSGSEVVALTMTTLTGVSLVMTVLGVDRYCLVSDMHIQVKK